MSLDTLFSLRPFALAEGSVYERLRRQDGLAFDPELAHASLVYDSKGAAALEAIHREYWAIGRHHGVPLVALTDTWRANRERIERSAFRGRPVNEDNVRFLIQLRERVGAGGPPIFIGGQTGPKGDGYKPAAAPGTAEAERFHAPQVEALAAAGVDFLQASTLPSVPEAVGIARAMARTGRPYVLSFVIRRDGTVLDGTPLAHAIARIDEESAVAPSGYAVNCVHPAVMAAGLATLPAVAVRRLVSLQANASSKSPEELDGSAAIDADEPQALAEALAHVARAFGIPIVGGCCGTDARHINCLAALKREEAP
jgi:homocysteine S-methyltransferase